MEDKIIKALDCVTYYNDLAPTICEWIEYGDAYLEQNTDKNKIIPCPKGYLESMNDIESYGQLKVIWMILVSLFGEYGTSPRSGWIESEHWEECKEFINKICKTSFEDNK